VNWVECKGQSQVDSHFDNVEIQAALDSLPTTGGTVYLSGGTFTLAKQIARAIDNVTFRGEGSITTVNFNGSTPVISAGSQNGWRLEDFNTDAGDVTITTVTIASGAITITGPGVYIVAPETGATDNLDTITDSCITGDRILLRASAGSTITMRSAQDNILCPRSMTALVLGLTSEDMMACELMKSGATWYVMCGGSASGVIAKHRTFTEDGAGTYTATVVVPGCSTILDVRWSNKVVWSAATSATLNVGDTQDADGYFDDVDVKAAPIADVNGAGGISSFLKDTGAGAYSGLTKYLEAGTTVTATVVSVGAGTAGRSRLTVIYAVGEGLGAAKA
jgi:hypothetical protein